MRKAAKSADRLKMIFRVLDVIGQCRVLFGKLMKKPQRLALIVEILAVLERQIDEGAAGGRERQVESAGDGTAGGIAGHRVGGERARGPAKHIARKLIEQQDKGQSAGRRGLPHLELAGCGAFVVGHEG